MKIALHDSDEEHLQLMRQLGVEYVVSAVGPGNAGALEIADLLQKKGILHRARPDLGRDRKSFPGNLLQGHAGGGGARGADGSGL